MADAKEVKAKTAEVTVNVTTTKKADDGKEVKAKTAEATVTSAGGTTTKKIHTTTVVETVEHSEDSRLARERYRPTIQSKNVVIQRSAYGQLGGARSGYGADRSVRYGMTTAAPVGASMARLQQTGMTQVTSTRQQEKKDMQDLNERFANYIEKVRFLEAQNRRLADELEKLKSKWGKETTSVKVMYEAELAEARKLLDEANREKGRLEVRLAAVQEELEELKDRHDNVQNAYEQERERGQKLIQQISDIEAEILMLRRRAQSHDNDRDKDKRLIQLLKQQLQVARTDLDKQNLAFIDAENQRQTLDEELQFIKVVHEQEMKELAALAYRDTTSENREYWQSEMGQALREIQQSYDDQIDGMRVELEATYSLQVTQLSQARPTTDTAYYVEESKRLKVQLGSLYDKIGQLDVKNASLLRELEALRQEKDEIERRLTQQNGDLQTEVVTLRAEMEAILRELQNISDSKLGLELEIAAYRKLLEGEESRSELRQAVDQSHSFKQTETAAGGSTKVTKVVKGEMSAKTTFQRSAKGPIAIAEVSADGKFVQLENTGHKEENLSEWFLKRNIDGEDKISFKLPKDLIVKPGDKIKIWAKGAKPADAGPGDLEFDKDNWGSGKDVVTKLFNPANEDRASHIQRTTFA